MLHPPLCTPHPPRCCHSAANGVVVGAGKLGLVKAPARKAVPLPAAATPSNPGLDPDGDGALRLPALPSLACRICWRQRPPLRGSAIPASAIPARRCAPLHLASPSCAGIVNAFDVDDNGDLAVDNVDNTTARPPCTSTQHSTPSPRTTHATAQALPPRPSRRSLRRPLLAARLHLQGIPDPSKAFYVFSNFKASRQCLLGACAQPCRAGAGRMRMRCLLLCLWLPSAAANPMHPPTRRPGPPPLAQCPQVPLENVTNWYLNNLDAMPAVFKKRLALAMQGMPPPGHPLAGLIKDICLNCLGLPYCK